MLHERTGFRRKGGQSKKGGEKNKGKIQTIKTKHCSTHTSPSGKGVTAKHMMDVNNVA